MITLCCAQCEWVVILHDGMEPKCGRCGQREFFTRVEDLTELEVDDHNQHSFLEYQKARIPDGFEVAPGTPLLDESGKEIGKAISSRVVDDKVLVDFSIPATRMKVDPIISEYFDRCLEKQIIGNSVHNNERRVKVVRVGERMLLDVVFLSTKCLPTHLMVLKGPGLPTDAKVVGIYHDFYSRSFVFRVEHPSFDPVLDGAHAPLLFGNFSFQFEMIPVQDRPGYTMRTEMMDDCRTRIIYEENLK